jgi:uncharacterized protein with HEPN domain
MPSEQSASMLADEAYGPLNEIERHIDLAHSFAAGFSYDAFQADRRTVYGVLCCLEIIADASRRLPSDVKARNPDVPWPHIEAPAHVVRHDRDEVLADTVWRTLQHDLNSLNDAIEHELSRLKP